MKKNKSANPKGTKKKLEDKKNSQKEGKNKLTKKKSSKLKGEEVSNMSKSQVGERKEFMELDESVSNIEDPLPKDETKDLNQSVSNISQALPVGQVEDNQSDQEAAALVEGEITDNQAALGQNYGSSLVDDAEQEDLLPPTPMAQPAQAQSANMNEEQIEDQGQDVFIE